MFSQKHFEVNIAALLLILFCFAGTVSRAAESLSPKPPKAAMPFKLYGDDVKNPPYIWSGWMGDAASISVDPSSNDKPHTGRVSMKCQFKATSGYGAVAWQNPVNDWGSQPGGYDLSNAKSLTFWARGAAGGEVISVKLGIIGKDAKYPDSGSAAADEITLTPEWKQYTIDLAGVDLSVIKTGFMWLAGSRGTPVTFYLDDIQYETRAMTKAAPLEPSAILKNHKREESPFGPNVFVLDPTTPDAQSLVDAIYSIEAKNEFGPERYAILLKPGKHSLDIRVGFYTHVLGLGQTPDDVEVTGAIRAIEPPGSKDALCTFWRAVENVAIAPTGGQCVWAVSQATAMRRVHIRGDLVLSQAGYSSGGHIVDTVVDGTINSGSQQQFLFRNVTMKNFESGVWNMVFVGVPGAPTITWPQRPYTTIATAPITREKPYLTLAADGGYAMIVPAMRRESAGAAWPVQPASTARQVPLDRFHIARPETDTAGTINDALTRGKHLLFTPGIYELDDSIHVKNPDTIVYSLGYATLVPIKGTPALLVDDVPGVTVAGIFIDAGANESSLAMQIGPPNSQSEHADNPIALYDIYTRCGGPRAGKCKVFLEINSNNVIGDNFWLWRADHGKGAAWTENPTANGLIVNGNDVTVYGLFVEHVQEYQTLWNGERGRVYLYQSEMPYDPPSQEGWGNRGRGYASYKVSDHVNQHEAYGLGVYCVFKNAPIIAATAVEAPSKSGIIMQNIVTVRLGGQPGGIRAILNDQGAPVIHHSELVVRRLSAAQHKE